jgi:hydrogenase nickel incorporation protein HypB
MGDYRIIEVKQSVFADNNADAAKLRDELKAEGTFLINLMSSPGAGKTTTLKRTIAALRDTVKLGVMEADIDGEVDAAAIEQAGARAIQIHTGGMCHLDADMTRQGIREFGTEDLDVVILENVGNLVCPAEFDTGAMKNVMILSVPEGDDKPLKYPLMFRNCQLVLINKCDVLPVFDDFDCEKVKERIRFRNPDCQVIFLSAKTGEGFDAWIDTLKEWISEFKSGKMAPPVHYDA